MSTRHPSGGGKTNQTGNMSHRLESIEGGGCASEPFGVLPQDVLHLLLKPVTNLVAQPPVPQQQNLRPKTCGIVVPPARNSIHHLRISQTPLERLGVIRVDNEVFEQPPFTCDDIRTQVRGVNQIEENREERSAGGVGNPDFVDGGGPPLRNLSISLGFIIVGVGLNQMLVMRGRKERTALRS